MSENKCWSLHPKREPTWLFSDVQERECLTCNLVVVSRENYIHSVRLAASQRCKLLLQNPKSIDLLSTSSLTCLKSVVTDILCSVKMLSTNNSEIVLHFVQDLVCAAFAFDMHILDFHRFRFSELLMSASVSVLRTGNKLDASTTVTLILLSSLLMEAVQRDDVDSGIFYLSFKNAISGVEKNLLFAVADFLISGSSWHGFDVTKASVSIICALLSVYAPIEQQFMHDFSLKLAQGFQGAEGSYQQGNLMELTYVLLDSSMQQAQKLPKSTEHSDSISLNCPSTKDFLFRSLNKENALTDILKTCILSNVQSTKEASIKVIAISCTGSREVTEALVNDGIVEYIFEGLRSHGTECIDPLCCSNIGLYVNGLNMLSKENPESLSSKWEYGFEIILQCFLRCSNTSAVRVAFSLLKQGIRSLDSTHASFQSFAKSILTLVGRLGVLASANRSDSQSLQAENEESDSKQNLTEALHFLVEYCTVSRMTFDCTSSFIDIIDLAISVFRENPISQNLMKAFLGQLLHFKGQDDSNLQCPKDIQERVLHLVFTTFGHMAVHNIKNLLESDSGQASQACECAHLLEILEMGLSNSFLLPKLDPLRDSVLLWCWQHITPVTLLAVGNYLPVSMPESNGNDREPRQVIRDYIYLLTTINEISISKSNIAEIPTSFPEFEKALKSNTKSVSSDIALMILNKSIEFRVLDNQLFWKMTLQSLEEKIATVQSSESETVDQDTFEAVSLYFTLALQFPKSKRELQIPMRTWLRVVSSTLFCPDSNPNLFLHVICNVENLSVKFMAWKKYSMRDRDGEDCGKDLDERLGMILDSNLSAMDGLCEVLVCQELSEEMMLFFLSLISAHSGKKYSPVPALRKLGAIQALREAFRYHLVRRNNNSLSENARNETHQLAGLLNLISEHICDWSEEELQQITLMVCDNLKTTTIVVQETNTTLLLGILRFFIRLFQDPVDKSLKGTRSYVTMSACVCKLIKIINMHSTNFLSANETMNHLVSGSAACLMVLLFDHFADVCDEQMTLKLSQQLPQSSLAWASLVSTLSESAQGDHAHTCRATNCCALLSTILEASKPSFQNAIGNCRVLRSALVSACISQNIILSSTALHCLVHIVSKADNVDQRFQQLPTEKALTSFLTAKLLRKNSEILRAEAAYLGICIERSLIDISDVKILEALEALRPNALSSENPYLMNKVDVIKLMCTVEQHQESKRTYSETRLSTVRDPQTPMQSSRSTSQRRKVIFGAQAIVLG